MKRTYLVTLLCILFSVMTVQAETIEIMAGMEDDFALPADAASPSSDLKNAILSMGKETIHDFDIIAGINGGQFDSSFAHTFSNLPEGIIAASLDLRIKGGTVSSVDTDGIIISFVDSSTSNWIDAMVYRRTFGPIPGGGLIFQDPGPGLIGEWGYNSEAYLTLDLAALPRDGSSLDIISQINEHGFLDVAVNDETGVDFLKLTYTVVPEPATLLLLGLGGLLIRRSAS